MKKLHPYPIKILLCSLLVVPILQLTLGAVDHPLYIEYFWYFILGILFISVLLAFWLFQREKVKELTRFYLIANTFLRYYMAWQIGMYAISKLTGVQFQIYEYVRDVPIGKLSGINLTWYYFGNSLGLTIVVGVLQYASAVLLVFRRTQLLGALLLFPVILNIFFINIFYNISFAAALNSVHFTLICLYILWLHSDWMLEAVKKFYKEIPSVFASKTSKIIRIATRVLVLGSPFVLMAILPKLFAEPGTPIDGVWKIKSQIVNGKKLRMMQDTTSIKRLYISNQRSAVLNLGDGFFGAAFSLNDSTQEVKVKLRSNPDSLVGKYLLRDSVLIINGMRGLDTVQYEFEWVRESKWGK